MENEHTSIKNWMKPALIENCMEIAAYDVRCVLNMINCHLVEERLLLEKFGWAMMTVQWLDTWSKNNRLVGDCQQ